MSDKIELSQEQKQEILDFWNRTPNEPPAVKDIVVHIFGQEYDHRAPQSKAITAFLASRRLKPKPRSEAIEISEAHKEFIKNNASTMTAVDMARVIFANNTLTNLNAETRAVAEQLRAFKEENTIPSALEVDEVPSGDYVPPNTIHKVLKKVNTCTNNEFTLEDIPATVRKGLDALIKYLATYRFVRQINSFESELDRKSFEDAFVRYTYNKPDLTQEEIDQYITLAHEGVLIFKAQRRSERLQRMLEEITTNDAESVKISMSLVEMIGKAQTEYNLCIQRQQKLLDDLTEKRSEKLGKQIKENASVLNLIQAWKQEETRRQWLRLAEIEDRAIENEIEKFASMEQIKAQILGLTKDEAKYG